MKINTSFTVPVPPEQAWPLLLDVPRIAPCLPGASLTADLGDRRYKGQATVKVGPVQLQFGGEAHITDVDETGRTARVAAKGADTKGRGNASADVTFALKPESSGTRVDVVTELQLVGHVAQYGRASGLLKEIANQIVQQFAANLREEINRSAPPQANTEPLAPNGGTAEAAVAPKPAGSPAPSAAQTRDSPLPPPVRPARELSALSLLWNALRAIVGRWLGRFGNGSR